MSTTERPAANEQAGVFESAGAWLGAVRDACADGLEIAAVEVRLAAVRLGLLLAACVVAGLLAAGAWLFFVGALVSVAVAAGLTLPAAMAGGAALNGALLWGVCAWITRLARAVRFEATRRALARHGGDTDRAASTAVAAR